jgi:hypothetical protein
MFRRIVLPRARAKLMPPYLNRLLEMAFAFTYIATRLSDVKNNDTF